jgi:glucose/arabinose dehydrogenase
MRRPGPVTIAACCAVAALPAAAQTINDARLAVISVATGLSSPTSLAFIGPSDILIAQKNDGRVRRVLNGALQAGAVLDVAVHFSSERGLLGMAVDPDFLNNGWVYLYYTESSSGADTSSSGSIPLGNRIYRYRWNGVALVEPLLLISLPATPGPNHDGGVLTFGPDDALYAVIGDLNRSGKTQNIPTGPDPDDTGVILRLGTLGQTLPDSPFFDPARPADPLGRAFAYGVRNSFGLAFDPRTGFLWDTENGPDFYDEVNQVSPGFNSGWRPIMGPDALDPDGEEDLWVAPGSAYRDPELSWKVPVAPTALVFPATPRLGCELQDRLLVGDVNCGNLYRLTLTPERDSLLFTSQELSGRVADNSGATCQGGMSEILFGGGWRGITDLEVGPDGSLYALSIGLGTLFRVAPKSGRPADSDGDGADDACDCLARDSGAYAPAAEVPRLRISGAALTRLGWDSQSAAAGSSIEYALASGDVGRLGDEGGFASACALASGLAVPAFADARPDPPPGLAYYYLARAANACDPGTYGDGAGPAPDPRDPLDVAVLPACDCGERAGGAFVRFDISGQSLTVWVTNAEFIDTATALLASGKRKVPIFNTLLDGTDCDPQWTWHVDPADVVFADAAIELCDGVPSHIEANKDYWINTVGAFCPWSAVVAAVDDRR